MIAKFCKGSSWLPQIPKTNKAVLPSCCKMMRPMRIVGNRCDGTFMGVFYSHSTTMDMIRNANISYKIYGDGDEGSMMSKSPRDVPMEID